MLLSAIFKLLDITSHWANAPTRVWISGEMIKAVKILPSFTTPHGGNWETKPGCPRDRQALFYHWANDAKYISNNITMPSSLLNLPFQAGRNAVKALFNTTNINEKMGIPVLGLGWLVQKDLFFLLPQNFLSWAPSRDRPLWLHWLQLTSGPVDQTHSRTSTRTAGIPPSIGWSGCFDLRHSPGRSANGWKKSRQRAFRQSDLLH